MKHQIEQIIHTAGSSAGALMDRGDNLKQSTSIAILLMAEAMEGGIAEKKVRRDALSAMGVRHELNDDHELRRETAEEREESMKNHLIALRQMRFVESMLSEDGNRSPIRPSSNDIYDMVSGMIDYLRARRDIDADANSESMRAALPYIRAEDRKMSNMFHHHELIPHCEVPVIPEISAEPVPGKGGFLHKSRRNPAVAKAMRFIKIVAGKGDDILSGAKQFARNPGKTRKEVQFRSACNEISCAAHLKSPFHDCAMIAAGFAAARAAVNVDTGITASVVCPIAESAALAALLSCYNVSPKTIVDVTPLVAGSVGRAEDFFYLAKLGAYAKAKHDRAEKLIGKTGRS